MIVPHEAGPVTYVLPKPPALSGCYTNVSGRGRVKTNRYRTWARAAGNEITAQGRRKYFGKVHLTMTVPYRSNSDLDNYWKATKDLLKDMQVIVDDSMRYCIRETAEIGERFTITVTPV